MKIKMNSLGLAIALVVVGVVALALGNNPQIIPDLRPWLQALGYGMFFAAVVVMLEKLVKLFNEIQHAPPPQVEDDFLTNLIKQMVPGFSFKDKTIMPGDTSVAQIKFTVEHQKPGTKDFQQVSEQIIKYTASGEWVDAKKA